MERIDAHCHFWDPARGDYDWLANGPPALDPLRRAFGPDELARSNGGRRVIAVQAADTVDETRYLLTLAKTFPQIAGVVGWVDLARADSIVTLVELAGDPVLKGIRPMLQDLAEDDWIATRPDPLAVQAMVDLGLRFDALVMTRHLAPLARFVAEWPDLPVIINHCAKPRMEGPLDPVWQSGMRKLAGFAHVHCKLSGLLTELPPDLRTPDRALAALRPVVADVLDMFGPDRIIWGSDWPVLTLAASHGDWQALTNHLLGDLDKVQRAAILGGNAQAFYGIGGSHA